jgi:hypothetical protein
VKQVGDGDYHDVVCDTVLWHKAQQSLEFAAIVGRGVELESKSAGIPGVSPLDSPATRMDPYWL